MSNRHAAVAVAAAVDVRPGGCTSSACKVGTAVLNGVIMVMIVVMALMRDGPCVSPCMPVLSLQIALFAILFGSARVLSTCLVVIA